MSIMAQTLQLAYKIALVWVGGFILAVAVNAILPDKSGISFFGDSDRFVPYNCIGFWTCLLAAVTVTAMVVIRSMLIDFNLRQMH